MTATEQNASTRPRKGHDSLLDQSGFSVERLPMLGVVFDRFVAEMVEGLRLLSRTPIVFSDRRNRDRGPVRDF